MTITETLAGRPAGTRRPACRQVALTYRCLPVRRFPSARYHSTIAPRPFTHLLPTLYNFSAWERLATRQVSIIGLYFGGGTSFCMGVKLGLIKCGRNTGWGCLRQGCGGRYLGLRGTREQGSGENYTVGSFMILTPNTIHRIKKNEMGGACGTCWGEARRGACTAVAKKSSRKVSTCKT